MEDLAASARKNHHHQEKAGLIALGFPKIFLKNSFEHLKTLGYVN